MSMMQYDNTQKNLFKPIYLPASLNLENVKIESLNLSARPYNCLKRAGVDFVSQLDGITPEKLFSIKHMGKKSVDEICRTLVSFFSIDTIVELDFENNENVRQDAAIKEIFLISNSSGIVHRDMPVETMDLSVRSYNVLTRNGVYTLKDLKSLDENVLRSFRNLGKKSFEEIIQKRDEYAKKYECSVIESLCEEEKHLVDSIVEELQVFLTSVSKDKLSLVAASIFARYGKEHHSFSEENIGHIANELVLHPLIRNAIKTDIYGKLDEWEPLSLIDLMADIATSFFEKSSLEVIISEMIEGKLIDECDGNIKKHHESIFDSIEQINNERNKKILMQRLQGQTLEEIGSFLNITRERVRQILNQEFAKIRKYTKCAAEGKIFIEDKYAYMFQKYELSKEQFCSVFKVSEAIYYYLSSVYERGEIAFSEFLECEDLPLCNKDILFAKYNKNKIIIDGEKIEKNKTALAHYVLEKYCHETLPLKQFMGYYNVVLKNLNLDDQKKLKVEERTASNILASSMLAFWKSGKQLRYYNINDYDYTDFFKTLNLEQYRNIEYSTYKFFRDYPDLMKEYDIQDEYELHNLLKKTLKDNKQLNIKFDRMPTIEFGNADRNTQVLHLLLAHAPISNVDLANLYEEEYGVKVGTVLANYFNNFDRYFHDGIFSFDFPRMPEDHYNQMDEWFVEDFYFIEDLKRSYLSKVQGADSQYFNPHNIKRFGYKIYSTYVIKEIYVSASDYFRCILTDKEILDVSELPPKVRTIPSYYSELQKLKDTYEILEIAPTRYVNISVLVGKGYCKSDIEDYCDKVTDYVGLGEYFTIKSLCKKGFDHPLNRLEYEDWFYGALLAMGKNTLKCKRFGGTRIFLKSVRDITVIDLLKHTMRTKGISDIRLSSLIRLLSEEYGVESEKHKIIPMINESALNYDTLNDMVYYDFSSLNI